MLKAWAIGEARIYRFVEIDSLVDPPGNLFKDASVAGVQGEEWLRPHFATVDGNLLLSFQCFLLKSCGKTILVDTCLGADKTREYDIFRNLQSNFLNDLTVIGESPESVDIVLCTHLHHDHVGWNTRRVDGQWEPTFPKARYLFGRQEWSHWQEQLELSTAHFPHMQESVLPIIEAGLVDFVEPGHRVTDEVSLEATPGHTPGHVSVCIRSGDEEAVITGDVMHHPVQCAYPDWRTHFCTDDALARETRRQFLERHTTRRTVVFGSHFPEPTAGRFERHGEAWRFIVL
jgi:glyoxylase-like metal-dependent hydrolase (beta-lactamase superfamily II)